MTRYAVLGNPVAHSKSPQIHSMFAAQTGDNVEYSAIPVEAAQFDSVVRQFFAEGGGGLNITVPFKETAYRLSEQLSPAAALAKAVNTLYPDENDLLIGDNTDGAGLVTDIQHNHDFSIHDKKLLLLGAGGAVRGALGPLVEQGPAGLTILNRTLGKAEQLRHDFSDLVDLKVADYERFKAQKFDLIINGTSLGLFDQAPPLSAKVIGADCCCYDMMYADRDTPFVRWARNNGAGLALDGLGMLVEQAAESFRIWCGVRPDTAPVLEFLRKQCNGGRSA